jgi:molybdopterin-guanine dinucleotide biosynthesis protein A
MSTIQPMGVVLAGGQARRLGGEKAMAALAGVPLVSYPLQALRTVLDDVVVVAKPRTRLPPLDVEVLQEPAEPHHPLVGIICALHAAAGRPVLIAAGDLPFLDLESLRRLLAGPAGAAVIAAGPRSGPQPLLGVYRPAALAPLQAAADAGTAPMREVVLSLRATLVAVPEDALFNVNTPEDLAEAELRLAGPTRT